MKVKASIYTDAGRKRSVNQDASLIKVASASQVGRISFVAVCDGMGGLSKGEVASCKAVRTLENWFMEELPLILGTSENKFWEIVEISWRRLLADINKDIRRYGKHRGIQLGTTLTAFLQVGRKFILMNVGDSRIYLVSRNTAITASMMPAAFMILIKPIASSILKNSSRSFFFSAFIRALSAAFSSSLFCLFSALSCFLSGFISLEYSVFDIFFSSIIA